MDSALSRAHFAARPTAFAIRAVQLVLAALLLLIPKASLAADTKVYMGSFCTPDTHFNLVNASAEGSAIASVASQSFNVVCPIVKSVYDDSRLDSVTVNTDLGGGGSVSCTLAALNAIKQAPQAPLETALGAVSGSGPQPITFGTFGNTISGAPWQTSQWRYYELTCTLSAFTSITSYAVVERGNFQPNRKTYPSSMCREDELDTDGAWLQHTGHWLNSRETFVGSVVSYVCPIIDDRTGNTAATQTAEIAVGPPVNDFRQLTCTLFSNAAFFGPVDQRSATIQGNTALENTSVPLNLDLNTSVTWGSYYIRCSMDGSGDSKIYSYRIRENG